MNDEQMRVVDQTIERLVDGFRSDLSTPDDRRGAVVATIDSIGARLANGRSVSLDLGFQSWAADYSVYSIKDDLKSRLRGISGLGSRVSTP
jgi:hypothetical protein